jgi:tetratricopeptide (TPR) repeat protein
MNRALHRIITYCIAHFNQTHIHNLTIDLISKSRIADAVAILRMVIMQSQCRSTPINLMNQYILLLDSEIWVLPMYEILRAEIFAELKSIVEFPAGTVVTLTNKCSQHPSEINKSETENVIPSELFSKLRNIAKDRKYSVQLCGSPFDLVSAASASSSSSAAAAESASSSSSAAESAAASDQGSVQVYNATFLLAYFLYKDQQFEAAIGLLNRLTPSALVLWLRGVIYQYHTRDFILACETYVCAITMDLGFAYSYYSLAKLLSEYGDTHTSDFVYRRCLVVDPYHYMARLNRAIELDNFDFDKTEELTRVISINPACKVAKELYELCSTI